MVYSRCGYIKIESKMLVKLTLKENVILGKGLVL